VSYIDFPFPNVDVMKHKAVNFNIVHNIVSVNMCVQCSHFTVYVDFLPAILRAMRIYW
jgi:hypothetical protein